MKGSELQLGAVEAFRQLSEYEIHPSMLKLF